MATLGNFYLNASTFDLATAVFTNASLTTLAPDDYYSNGLIVRQQVGGQLLPSQGCSECGPVNINYTISKETFRGCTYSISSFGLKIAQNPPSYNIIYVNNTPTSSPTTGYVNVPAGQTQIIYFFQYGGSSCTRVQVTIEINGVQVAFQQFPSLSIGTTYQLTYTTNLTSPVSINAYATNY